MNSVARPVVPSINAAANAAIPQVSLLRLYALRVSYLILAAGLGTYVWPSVGICLYSGQSGQE